MWNALNHALSRLTWPDGVRAEEQAGVASTGLSTWQCTHRTHHQAPARPGSLPFITYITASLVSSQMPWPLTSIFRLANETLTVFVVTDARSESPLHRMLVAHGCAWRHTTPAIALPAFAVCKASCHYSWRSGMQKLDILRQVPPELSRVVLIDADTVCVPPCEATLAQEFEAMPMTAWAAMGMSGSRQRGARGVLRVAQPPYDGPQSGVVMMHLDRLRALDAHSCGGGGFPWWYCALGWHGSDVNRSTPEYSWPFADQEVYRVLGYRVRVRVTLGLGLGFGVANLKPNPYPNTNTNQVYR